MTGEYMVLYDRPPAVSTRHSTIKDATLAFGKALNDHDHVKLVSIALPNMDQVVAEYLNDEPETGRHQPCPVCGRRHPIEDHGYDVTANRLWLAHDNHNHAQCHPKSPCKITGEEKDE